MSGQGETVAAGVSPEPIKLPTFHKTPPSGTKSLMKPPHPVWKSKLAMLAWSINKAIDNGNYDVSIDEVERATEERRVVQFIRDTLPTHCLLDISMIDEADEAAINEWFVNIKGNHDIHVQNRGLCLLMAWTIEMMQHAGDPDDFR